MCYLNKFLECTGCIQEGVETEAERGRVGGKKKNREERGEREKTEGRWEEKKKERNKWMRTPTFEL